jgi:thiosulfate/3-mercaptopyruvate sulfurtransferase
MATRGKRPKAAAGTAAKTAAEGPGPLVSAAWLRENVNTPGLRIIHVSPDRRVYNRRHIARGVLSDLHRELALRGTAPETGDAEREWLVPSRAEMEAVLRRWGVGEGDRVVLYDDVGKNRHAIRGYWLLRLYGYPSELVHVLDGGIDAWIRDGGPVTAERPEADLADGLRKPATLKDADPALIATHEEMLGWSAEATEPGGPTSVLDVRTPGEFLGTDLRARRGGHIPGARQRAWDDLLTDDGRIRPVEEMLAILRSGGVEPSELRATYCQGCVRASFVWFALHELAGLETVKPYGGSWEEWGNRPDSPIETTG